MVLSYLCLRNLCSIAFEIVGNASGHHSHSIKSKHDLFAEFTFIVNSPIGRPLKSISLLPCLLKSYSEYHQFIIFELKINYLNKLIFTENELLINHVL